MKPDCDICTTDNIILPKKPKGEILYCTCPFCNQKVGAEIYKGKITCPACGMEAEWEDSM